MAGVSGHRARLSFSSLPVAFTAEPTSKRVGTAVPNTVYRVTDTSRRVLDPATPIVVEVDATGGGTWVVASASSHIVDALDGVVRFSSSQGAAALVRISGAYLPRQLALQSFDVSASINTNMLEDTSHGGDGARTRVPGLRDMTLEMSSYASVLARYTTGDASSALAARLLSGEPLLVDYMPCGETVPPLAWRAWMLLENGGESTGVDDLLQSTLSFSSTQRALAGRLGQFASMSFINW